MPTSRGTLITLSVVCLLFAFPLTAQELWNNGPINGNVDAWNITGGTGFVVSDSMTLVGPPPCCHIFPNALDLAIWSMPGNTLQSAEVSITSLENGGTSYFDQTLNFTTLSCSNNAYGFDICTEHANISGVALGPGTYWLNVQNATSSMGQQLFWDENSGVGCTGDNGSGVGCPSMASENTLGTIPSEAFTLYGTSAGTTPEPGSLLLFGSGVAFAGIFRRRLKRAIRGRE